MQLGVAIQELSADYDRGRPAVTTRYFYFPYDHPAEALVSYEELFREFSQCALPSDGSLVHVNIRDMDLAAIVSCIDEAAMAAATLLLTNRSVRITQGESVPTLQRLRFLDTVAALLPYGMRARLSVSTGTTGPADEQVRLSFADTLHLRANTAVPLRAAEVVWGTTWRSPAKRISPATTSACSPSGHIAPSWSGCSSQSRR